MLPSVHEWPMHGTVGQAIVLGIVWDAAACHAPWCEASLKSVLTNGLSPCIGTHVQLQRF